MDAIIKHILLTFGVAVGTVLILEYILRLRPNDYRWWVVMALVIGVFILGVELHNI